MHLARINLNLFVVFDAIVTEGSVTAAADKLNLSQPAVSHALARLRELLDDPLFERRGQALLPTAAARALVPSVRGALRTLERAVRESASFDPARSERRFTIGIRNVAEGLVLPRLMRIVAAETAAIDIVAVRVDAAQLEAELASGRLDAALEVGVPASTTIRRELFWSDPLVVLARDGHPAAGPAGLDLDGYLAHEHVQISSRPRGAGLEDTALRRLGLERRVRLRCKDYAAACLIVAGTDLLATLPARYAEVV
ncbi:MAG: LysR family transcriptional regulator, partial [Burkholderiaceae bacterium]